MKYVVYRGENELIVCTKAQEAKTLAEMFGSDVWRDVEDYSREEVEDYCAYIRIDLHYVIK